MNLAPILATKLDVLRRQATPGLRLLLFTSGPSSRDYTPVSTGASVDGLVPKGWRKSRRRFDEDGSPAAVTILVSRSRVLTPAVLRRVSAFALLPKGEDSGAMFKCQTSGLADYADEPVWRFTATTRLADYTIPTADASAFAILLETGDSLLLETGDELLTEAA